MNFKRDFPIPVVDPTRTGVFAIIGGTIRMFFAELFGTIFVAPLMLLIVGIYRLVLIFVASEIAFIGVGGCNYYEPWHGWSGRAAYENFVDGNYLVWGGFLGAVSDIGHCWFAGTHCESGSTNPDSPYDTPWSPKKFHVEQAEKAAAEQHAASERGAAIQAAELASINAASWAVGRAINDDVNAGFPPPHGFGPESLPQGSFHHLQELRGYEQKVGLDCSDRDEVALLHPELHRGEQLIRCRWMWEPAPKPAPATTEPAPARARNFDPGTSALMERVKHLNETDDEQRVRYGIRPNPGNMQHR